jgi:hypothetical protein
LDEARIGRRLRAGSGRGRGDWAACRGAQREPRRNDAHTTRTPRPRRTPHHEDATPTAGATPRGRPHPRPDPLAGRRTFPIILSWYSSIFANVRGASSGSYPASAMSFRPMRSASASARLRVRVECLCGFGVFGCSCRVLQGAPTGVAVRHERAVVQLRHAHAGHTPPLRGAHAAAGHTHHRNAP